MMAPRCPTPTTPSEQGKAARSSRAASDFSIDGGDILATRSESSMSNLGKEINLGPWEVRCSKAIIHPDDRAKLEAAADAEVAFRIIPMPGERRLRRRLVGGRGWTQR